MGTSRIILDIGYDKLLGLLQRVGLGQSTGIAFPGESTGYLPYRDRWSRIEMATLSFGYGLTVTPLQLVQAYSILGADGVMRPLSLLKRDVPPEGTRVLDQKVAQDVRDMLGEVVKKTGTGNRAKVDSYAVGGKTGTARKVGVNGYTDERHIATFAGLVPIDDPRLAMVVVIDDPAGGIYYAGQTAAPVFSKVAASALRMLRVEPVRQLPMVSDINSEFSRRVGLP